jgi:uncharacterized protein (DUF305 family)
MIVDAGAEIGSDLRLLAVALGVAEAGLAAAGQADVVNDPVGLRGRHARRHAIEAESVAQSIGMTPPTEPNSKQKADYDRLSKLSGDKFDREFVSHMVMDHKKDIKEFEKEAKKSDAVGSFANETLPTLRKHLDTAQSLMSNATTGKR